MLVNDDEIKKRLNNPLNLLNRMRAGLTAPKRNAMDLFVKKSETVSLVQSTPALVPSNVPASVSASDIPHPSSDDLIDDADSKIKLATAHDKALELLNNSLIKLNGKIEND